MSDANEQGPSLDDILRSRLVGLEIETKDGDELVAIINLVKAFGELLLKEGRDKGLSAPMAHRAILRVVLTAMTAGEGDVALMEVAEACANTIFKRTGEVITFSAEDPESLEGQTTVCDCPVCTAKRRSLN